MWSIGVILYILLVGYPPFTGKTNEELNTNIKSGVYSKDSKEWKQVSPKAKSLVSKLLTVNPLRRISAQEALEHPWMKIASNIQNSKVDNSYFRNEEY